MHICPCSWALGVCKNIGIRIYFGLVTAKSVRFSHHFAFLYKSTQTCLFSVLHLWTAFQEAHLLGPSRIWQLWIPKSYEVFIEPPYIFVTPYFVCDAEHFIIRFFLEGSFEGLCCRFSLVVFFGRSLLCATASTWTHSLLWTWSVLKIWQIMRRIFWAH